MNEAEKKIQETVSEKRVKLHLFEPSNREIWTIVGKGKEHWFDPLAEFCSCPGFYFAKQVDKKHCYHLESYKLAKKENQFEIIRFADEEYEDFIKTLIDDI